jgi:outer membrane lipoprotein-sorting protein
MRLEINLLNILILVLIFLMWWQQSSGSKDLESYVSNILRSIEDELSSFVSNVVRSTENSSSYFSCLGIPVWEESMADS